MRRKGTNTPAISEAEQLKAIMEEVSPREPHIRIYRVNPDTKKHKFPGTAGVDGFPWTTTSRPTPLNLTSKDL